ncbi:MAG: PadR family transcriptional regulator AphA [Oleiphilaceae bacterium]|jgi:PadR family transcriptional regulator AphA
MSLKHAILVLLETEPSSGYDLLKQFNNSLGYFWNAKHQQIYQQLKLLSNENLIECKLEEQHGKPDKKIYKITKLGVSELSSWLSVSVKPNKINDALLVKIYGGHLTQTDNLLSELENHLYLHKKTLFQLKQIEQKYLKLSSELQEKYKLPYITLRRGILGEEAWLVWANEAIKMIKK